MLRCIVNYSIQHFLGCLAQDKVWGYTSAAGIIYVHQIYIFTFNMLKKKHYRLNHYLEEEEED